MTDEPLTDADWQVIQHLAEAFTQEQLRIEPTKNSLIAELKKVVAYLYAKLNDNALSPEQVDNAFFQYLKTLDLKGKQIARSGKTSAYYQAIHKVCTSEKLKEYRNQPTQILQILGWAARLAPYYKDCDRPEVHSSTAGIQDVIYGDRPKLKPTSKQASKPITKTAMPIVKTAMELALERAEQKKKREN